MPVGTPPNAEQAARKARSEMRLRAEGVAVNATLPVIADAASTTIRTPQAVAERAYELEIVAHKAYGQAAADVAREVTEVGAHAFLTPDEETFLANAAPSAVRADRAR